MTEGTSERIYLIVPTYNETSRLRFDGYFSILFESKDFRICFVDDGSTDGTTLILRGLSTNNLCDLVEIPVNSGKGNAIRHGMVNVIQKYNPIFLGYLDCDGAFSIETILDFTNKALQMFYDKPNVDCVIASRIMLSGRHIDRKTFRHWVSRVLITLIGFAYKRLPYDSQSGLKIMRSSQSLSEAISYSFATRWFFDIELMLRTNWLKEHKVWEEPVLAWRDVEGSNLTWKKFPSLLKEIWTISKLGRANRSNLKD